MLEAKKEQIVRRWFEAALSLYARDASAAFSRQKDRFANPVGHSLREGTLAIFEALLAQDDAAKIRQHLVEIIKIRAVQQFSASAALDFVFRLKDIVREEAAGLRDSVEISTEYASFERSVDEVALTAFDVYVECREQVFEIRSNEMKRSVSWIVDKLNKQENGPESTGAN
jgi:hypothetical protein